MILVDADSCPVKDEIVDVALRRKLRAIFVAGSYLRLPEHALVSLYVAGDGFDAADDAIAEVARTGTVTITADILLAGRVIARGGAVLDPRGRELTETSIGEVTARRNLMADLRGGIEQGGGPPAYTRADRAGFKVALDRVLTRLGL